MDKTMLKQISKMRLQSVGIVEGTEAGQLKVGDVTRWNFGDLERITAIEFSKTGKTIICKIEFFNAIKGEIVQSERKMRVDRLVNIVGRGNTVLTSNKSFEVIEETKQPMTNELNNELTTKYVNGTATPEEEKQLEQYHLELQEKGMTLTNSKPSVNENFTYKVVVSVDQETNNVGEFEVTLTGKQLIEQLAMNEVLEIKEEITLETTEHLTVATESTIEASYTLNEEKQGIEVSFTSKPSEEVREQLKMNGFRWSRYQKVWFAKQTSERLAFVQLLTGTQEGKELDNTSLAPTFDNTLPEIDINDIESYTVDQNLQDREHDANWLFRRDKLDRTKEIQDLFQSFNDQVVTVLSKTDNQYIIYKLKKSLQRFKKKYHETFVSYLSAKANNPSIAVTGRSGRNMNRYNKLLDRQDKLMSQLSELLEDIKKSISYYENKIRTDKESKIKQQVSNTTTDIVFTTETKEFTYMGFKEKKRVYVYNGYWICKLWNCFRIFHNGKELKTTLKTTSKLEEAKQYVAFLVQQEAQKQAI
ncbi:hypothetical protein AB1283_00695 [Bacillus sp. S13(2024)]|uniref:hypothetical protein n=1 Tax=Bacillus sp. S13(2024) TaxID=3162885 RepID=UPI003D1CDC21